MTSISDKRGKVQRDNAHETTQEVTVKNERPPVPELELFRVLDAHRIWLSSNGKDGRKAHLERRTVALSSHSKRDLRNTDLRCAELKDLKFEGADLYGADLRGADLTNTDFGKDADLRYADFRGCILTGGNFGQANVEEAMFQGAHLEGANLAFVRNVVPDQFAATVLSRAVLPSECRKLPGVSQVNRIVMLGRTSFFMMLASSIFTLFVIATTEDVELISGSSAETLPLVEFEMPVVGFFHLAPVIVLALYLYLTLYLVTLMEEMSELPSVFPDNRKLDQHVEPWVMTSLIYRNMPNLDRLRPSFSHLREIGAIAIAWWVAPIVIGWVWLYYIRAHVLWSSFLHASLLVAAVVLGLTTYRIGIHKLRTASCPDSMRAPAAYRLIPTRVAVGAFLGIVVTFGISYAAMTYPRMQYGNAAAEGNVADPTPPSHDTSADTRTGRLRDLIANVDENRFLNVSYTSISTKPDGWRDPLTDVRNDQEGQERPVRTSTNGEDIEKIYDKLENTPVAFRVSKIESLIKPEYMKLEFVSSGVRSVDLSGRDLRGVVATGAFLATSILESATLDDADLTNADLRGANLRGIRGKNVIFEKARLDGADLSGAVLEASTFPNASMRGVNMQKSFLEKALLSGADLTGANLSYAKLSGATLYDAKLEGTQMLETWLRGANLIAAKLSGAHMPSAKLAGADLSGADLTGANMAIADLSDSVLRGANLSGADLTGANLAGADLTTSMSLAQTQLDSACGDDRTKLPIGLTIKACSTPVHSGDGG